jgi:hypothetical protein
MRQGLMVQQLGHGAFPVLLPVQQELCSLRSLARQQSCEQNSACGSLLSKCSGGHRLAAGRCTNDTSRYAAEMLVMLPSYPLLLGAQLPAGTLPRAYLYTAAFVTAQGTQLPAGTLPRTCKFWFVERL